MKEKKNTALEFSSMKWVEGEQTLTAWPFIVLPKKNSMTYLNFIAFVLVCFQKLRFKYASKLGNYGLKVEEM